MRRAEPDAVAAGWAFLPVWMYRYYYGSGGGWGIGWMATGGGYFPAAGHSYATSTVRGGFGGSFGGGEGGGGE